MTKLTRLLPSIWRNSFRWKILAVLIAVVTLPLQLAQAQTFTVLHSFTGGADGASPYAPVTIDSQGNLYGTTAYGGNGTGVVFKMTRTNGGWTFTTLYKFGQHNDASQPYAPVVFDPDGSLYGTTFAGGTQNDGSVFNLRPPARFPPSIFAPWTETVLYSFRGGTADGLAPYAGVTFDAAGNIYGTTSNGGSYGPGTVYELSPSAGGWTERVIYNFSFTSGAFPYSNVIFGNADNLYGTTTQGGSNGRYGAIYRLTNLSGRGWSETFLYSFTDLTANSPFAGLTLDPTGNFYGATAGGEGAIFELTPSDGTLAYSQLYGSGGNDFCGDVGNLVTDAAGNLYGTTVCDGDLGAGTIFKLTHFSDGWMYTTLYSFTGDGDGAHPEAGVALGANGNLYGTTIGGGAHGNGTVWELTP